MPPLFEKHFLAPMNGGSRRVQFNSLRVAYTNPRRPAYVFSIDNRFGNNAAVLRQCSAHFLNYQALVKNEEHE